MGGSCKPSPLPKALENTSPQPHNPHISLKASSPIPSKPSKIHPTSTQPYPSNSSPSPNKTPIHAPQSIHVCRIRKPIPSPQKRSQATILIYLIHLVSIGSHWLFQILHRTPPLQYLHNLRTTSEEFLQNRM